MILTDRLEVNKERIQILESLVSLSSSLPEITRKLSGFPWDSDEKLILITWRHIRSILNRYLAGELSEQEVETWANLVEGRDDIGFESDFKERIRNCLHELANPLLTHSLDKHRAKMLLGEQ